MRSLWRGCVIQLALWAGIAASFGLYAQRTGRAGPDVWPVSIGIALLVTLSLLLGHTAFGAVKEGRVLARGVEGVPPRDGEWTAVCGEIRSSSPLQAPLSGEPAVVYEYSIGREQRVGGSMSFLIYFDGKALAESTIFTAFGAVRLLVVPALEVEAASLDRDRAVENARDYLARATFAPRTSARDRSSALEREWTDDDGVFRIDKKYSAADVDLTEGFRFEERIVRPGERVCAFGVYSPERRGLIPDATWGRPARLMRGVASDATRAVRGRVIRYVVGASIFAVLATAAATGYLS